MLYYLYFAVFLAIALGCFTNCFPLALPSALALLVAAFSEGVNASHAADGKYLFLPFDGLPSDVLHFSLVLKKMD